MSRERNLSRLPFCMTATGQIRFFPGSRSMAAFLEPGTALRLEQREKGVNHTLKTNE